MRARSAVALALVVVLWVALVVAAVPAVAAEREIAPRYRHCQAVLFRLPAGYELPPRTLARLCLIQEWAHDRGRGGR